MMNKNRLGRGAAGRPLRNKDEIRLVLLEDQAHHAELIRKVLALEDKTTFRLAHVERLSDLRDLLNRYTFDAILLDLNVPDSHGLDTVHRLKEYLLATPAIVMTAYDDDDTALQAIQEGAQDYLVKGDISMGLLARSIHYAIERHQMQRELRSLSLTDELTGLYNRRGFLMLAGHHLKLARRLAEPFALIFSDLDALKVINDTFGHLEGDAALRQVAGILRQTFRESDIVARIGGDEFVILAAGVDEPAADLILARLRQNIAHYNEFSGKPYILSLSVGCAYRRPDSEIDLKQLLSLADKAQYAHKQRKQYRYKNVFR